MASRIAHEEGKLPTPTILITLDDGSLHHINAPPFLSQSGFFRHAFANRPLHSTSHKIHLPGIRRDLWLYFQHFITTGQIPGGIQHPGKYTGRADMARADKFDIRIGPMDCEIHHLVELLVIGERMQAPSFQEKIMPKLILAYKRFWEENAPRVPLGNVEYVFENLKNACLRRFVLDVLIFGMSDKTIKHAKKEGHLSMGVVGALKERKEEMKDRVRHPPWDRPSEYCLLNAPTGFF